MGERSSHAAVAERPSVRLFSADDAQACARIFQCAWQIAFPHVMRTVDVIAFRQRTQDETILVAEASGKGVVGFVSIYPPDSFIHHLYVDPSVHRRGVGRLLLAEAVALAGGYASLKCALSNVTALSFYRSLGWTEEGERGGDATGPWIRLNNPSPNASWIAAPPPGP